IDVTQNIKLAAIPAVEYNPVVYRLRNATTGSSEYWLIENRRQTGFDTNIPGSGLCIWHYDAGTAAGTGSNRYPPYRIALEQADGQFQLEYAGSSGDAGDPFPGATGNRNFHDYSTPATNLNDDLSPLYGLVSRIGVWDVSNADSVMYAELDIEYSRPWIVEASSGFVFNDDAPRGDGDGVVEAGEEIHFYCYIRNFMRYSYNVRAALASGSPRIEWVTPAVSFGTNLLVDIQYNTDPIIFRVKDSLTAAIDTFTVTIVTDSLPGGTFGSEFVKEFQFSKQVGATQVLVVDDDNGAEYQQEYVDALRGRGIPSRVWNVQSQGSPDSLALSGYRIVFWHTGIDTSTGAFSAANVAAMKGYLNAPDHHLCLGTYALVKLAALDNAFVADYLKASHAGNLYFPQYLGVPGTAIGNGTEYRPITGAPNAAAANAYMNVLSGGQSIFTGGPSGQIRGIAYAGPTYKTVLLTFAPELLNDNAGGTTMPKDTLISRILAYFGGQATSIHDGSPFPVMPSSFTLEQNYPNPFNPSTTIRYTLRSTGADFRSTPRTKLAVYNALGQRVATLVDEVQIPGSYAVDWDGSDGRGHRAASGVYFYRLERGDEAQTMKMVLLK
ncbi:MAG TPA: FlgD immunoglobulin-like domain containing protein, partial [candidate division Zixibacteria bacterium]|nr:FlgD immunoglobulin-like domain containing protein [candidate division Zixibacteria bacterium]